MTQKLGLNVLQVPDETALYAHISRAKYPAILLYGDRAPTAYAIKRTFPNMTVIVRQWPDAELFKRISPKDFLRHSREISNNGCVIHTHNEADLGAITGWEYEAARYAIENKQVICVLNPSTGAYDNPDFDRAKDLLKLAADFPQYIIVGLHAYAGGIVTSGVYGGYPDNAGVEPGKPGGVSLIQPHSWPTREQLENATCFHLGRHRFLYRWCDRNGIKRPRVIITETSFDYTGDIGAWLNNLKRIGGSVNGFKTLEPQWREWWPDLSRDAAYFAQMAWANRVMFNDVEAALLFGYGNNPDWVNYTIHDTGIPAMLETLADTVEPPPPPVEPPPIPTPDTKAQMLAMVSDAMDNLTAAKEQLASAVDTLNRLEETIETEL